MGTLKAYFRNLVPTSFYQMLADWKLEISVQLTRWYYWRISRRIRAKVRRGEKIRVLFLESEIAKWKTQSLFELMKASPYYEPIMGISRRDNDETKPPSEIMKRIQQSVTYFTKMGNPNVVVYDAEQHLPLDLRKLKPDIIFYQQGWYEDGCHNPLITSRFALLAYVPYYVPNYGDIKLEAQLPFHRVTAFYFLLSQGWVDALTSWARRTYYVGKIVSTGHTMLDYRYLHPAEEPKRQCVIYAPHFSFDTPGHEVLTKISTFPWSGVPILEYAKKHPEMNWIFKPHPVLYNKLTEHSSWTKQQVDAYYADWGKIGKVCMDGDYNHLFDEATCMVTDCGSYLTEFGATGKPVIHLISDKAVVSPMKPSQELYATYYDVHNLDEMYAAFDVVLEKQEDPKKGERQAAVKKAGLSGTYAAKNIMDVFAKEFGIRENG